jgi:hypothetical protein
LVFCQRKGFDVCAKINLISAISNFCSTVQPGSACLPHSPSHYTRSRIDHEPAFAAELPAILLPLVTRNRAVRAGGAGGASRIAT